ncbi:LysR family transcriptional regulator [Actinorhabdospora filicis]|uniref:LysR family transcriptional regulator n=1 Tax=Actinorhabdospora filicis TaxID=1785913 RepID=A0A9W6STQ0_9ACTN|nr:LysR substrate-binding domain-containing protein [Actinorhabdospora filicis]GLZ80576.1 LysR family transcriptional regulator [Actinorhabdospora filicis]
MLERQETETFLTLAEELHFGRTAARLRLSTARVSQLVRQLERRVGVPLFHRASRPVRLTPIGASLARDLRPAVAAMDAAVDAAVAAGRGTGGEVHVGYLSAHVGRLAQRAAALYASRHGGVVRAHEVRLAEALEGLRTGALDVLLGHHPVAAPDMTAGPVLISEPRVLAVADRHPLARRSSVHARELTRNPVITACCAPLPYEADVPEGPGADSFQEVLTLVGAGLGVFPAGAHAADFYPRPDVVYVPIEDAPPLEWGPVWATEAATAKVRAFTEVAVETAGYAEGPGVPGPSR